MTLGTKSVVLTATPTIRGDGPKLATRRSSGTSRTRMKVAYVPLVHWPGASVMSAANSATIPPRQRHRTDPTIWCVTPRHLRRPRTDADRGTSLGYTFTGTDEPSRKGQYFEMGGHRASTAGKR